MRALRQHFLQTTSASHRVCAMASASKFHLTPQTAGCYHVDGINQDSAAKASELLQKNHEDSDIFFNEEAFHSKCCLLSPSRVKVTTCLASLMELLREIIPST